ncbi:uncharacterized protein LOC126748927 [Anthonomus grandis grandis]|uniref:uncharacterized protein LOC126748927 n=1 Tax=Anthonomus grandis grandis TaxID=2921223 RepID=UPI002165CDB2|nr:uncharacterized protein LOC126748927 [Anthonomus grandis grandis]
MDLYEELDEDLSHYSLQDLMRLCDRISQQVQNPVNGAIVPRHRLNFLRSIQREIFMRASIEMAHDAIVGRVYERLVPDLEDESLEAGGGRTNSTIKNLLLCIALVFSIYLWLLYSAVKFLGLRIWQFISSYFP